MRSKADIEYHHDAPGPVVNVKVRDTWHDGYRAFVKSEPDHHPEFTEDWIEEHVSEDSMQAYWEFAIESGWENLQNDAEEIFGKGTKVYSCGRSGGYAYIWGITRESVDGWDCIEFNKWRRFAKYARQEADGIMYMVIDGIYYNKFEAWLDERSELRAPDIEAALGGR
jgi:hypothetical protein